MSIHLFKHTLFDCTPPGPSERIFLIISVWLLKFCKNINSYDMKIYFHSIKITLYLIKYIFIISSFFFHDIKICFNSVKINLYSVRNIFIIHIYIFIIWIFHWILFWWAYLVFQLYLQKSKFYFWYVNWTTVQGC